MSKSFRRKIDARAWITEQENAKNVGTWVDPSIRRKPFAFFGDQWKQGLVTRRPKTAAGYESIYTKHVLPHFGTLPIEHITKPVVSDFVAVKTVQVAPGTVKNIMNVLKPILSLAVEQQALPTNPAKGVTLPRAQKEEQHFLTARQVERLVTATPEPYGLLVRTAAWSGLRAGELAALRFRHLNAKQGRLLVRDSYAEVHGELLLGPVKSYERRTVPIPKSLAKLLGHLNGEPDAHIFTTGDGTPIRQSNFYSRVFKPTVRKTPKIPDGVRFHDMRHTFAALAVAEGAHPKALMEWLGHSSITQTMDTYGHLMPALEQGLMDDMDKTLRKAMKPKKKGEK